MRKICLTFEAQLTMSYYDSLSLNIAFPQKKGHNTLTLRLNWKVREIVKVIE